MTEINTRMTSPDHPPSDAEIAAWIGKKPFEYWMRIVELIEKRYPEVFVPEWLFGGKKHGWSLRYKKSKSFCTLIPEKNRFSLLMVFGAGERMKVETIKQSLSARTREDYNVAPTYSDGKWLLLAIKSNQVLKDAVQLLEVKRKPKNNEKNA